MGKVIGGMLAAALFSLATMSQATLLDRGPDLVYDDVLNIIWTRQAGDGVGRNLPDARTWAANPVFAGFNDWRLPYASVSVGVGPALSGPAFPIVDCNTVSELACRDNEMGYMFYYDLGGSLGDNKTGHPDRAGR